MWLTSLIFLKKFKFVDLLVKKSSIREIFEIEVDDVIMKMGILPARVGESTQDYSCA
jgi:hypothetical protein